MTSGPCSRRTREAVPRAEQFGDMITADHRVLNEEGESRHNHWYAVVVQDLPTQWIQSHPCKTKTSQVIYTDNSLEFGKSCEDLSSNHRTSTPHRSETQMVLLRGRYAELKKKRLLYCCNQAWMNNGGLVLWNAIAICEMFKTSWQMGQNLMRRRFGEPLRCPFFFLGVSGWVSSDFFKGPVKAPPIW